MLRQVNKLLKKNPIKVNSKASLVSKQNYYSTQAQAQSTPYQTRSEECISLENEYNAHNYHPLPVVFSRGEGIHVYDADNQKYMDFLSAYSAVNQGHCHPRIIKALIDQASKLTLSSRAFYNDQLGQFAKFTTELFGYERLLPMNTGAEAVETALKLARKWAYEKKGISMDKAKILAFQNNFHGRTLGIISMSTDPTATTNFGPFLPNVGPYCNKTGHTAKLNDIEALEAIFKANSKELAGLLIEPIQGEAGIVVPSDAFVRRAYELCKEHNVLFIADEIQTGLGRTGKLLAIEHVGVRPDMVLLGKALSGGVYPVSCVLADSEVMLTIKPGEHGSTYGGNPLGAAVATEALKALIEEDMISNSEKMGQLFRKELKALNHPIIKEVRGRGLLNAIEVNEQFTEGRSAWDLCLLMAKNGLLAKPTHDTIIRLAPPLVINEEQVNLGLEIIKKSLDGLKHTPISGE